MNNTGSNIIATKRGTVTVDVFKTADNLTLFHVESDNKDVLNVSEVIENALCDY